MRLDNARDEFLAFKRSATKRKHPASVETLKSYKGRLTAFIDWVRVTTHKSGTQQMTRVLVREYMEARATRVPKLSQHTLSLDSTALREFAEWGADEDRRYWAWEDVARIPFLDKPKTLPRPYTEPERDALMTLALEPEEQVLRGLLYYVGLRRQEAADLRLKDIRPPAKLPDGSTLPGRLMIMGKGARERVCEIHDDLWAILRAYLASIPAGTRLDRTVLVKSDGTSPWTGKMVQRHVRTWGKAAGVEGPKSHRMRHTFATNLYDATGDIKAVQELLGHASPVTTQVYTKLSDRRRAAAIKALPSLAALPHTTGLDYRQAEAPAAESPAKPAEMARPE